jgi:hypothetical protein
MPAPGRGTHKAVETETPIAISRSGRYRIVAGGVLFWQEATGCAFEAW